MAKTARSFMAEGIGANVRRVRERLPTIFSTPPPHPGTLQKVKERLARRVGVEFVAHQLRKSFATVMYDDDTPDEVVQDLLGHAPSVTRRYAPVTRRKREQAVLTLTHG